MAFPCVLAGVLLLSHCALIGMASVSVATGATTTGTAVAGVVAVGATVAVSSFAAGEPAGTSNVGLVITGDVTTGTGALQPGVATVTLAPKKPAEIDEGGKLEQPSHIQIRQSHTKESAYFISNSVDALMESDW
jgi:hypothetical protein